MITIWVKFYNPLSIDNKCFLKQLKIERRASAKKANTPPFPHEARLIIVGARSTWKYAFNSPYIHICLATYLLSVFSFQCFSPLFSPSPKFSFFFVKLESSRRERTFNFPGTSLRRAGKQCRGAMRQVPQFCCFLILLCLWAYSQYLFFNGFFHAGTKIAWSKI